ncbi:MAG: hypothetical protein QXW86_11830 [Saccharolobus sp.]|uniref:hypothetical protein n=1 Tax=Saccharolobus sp. TaxID=2100761 RepID=UPI00317FF9C4
MFLTTVKEPIRAGNILVMPFWKSREPKIIINEVEAVPENVVKYDARVDIKDPGSRKRCFLVEHVLGPLRLVGITNALVVGVDRKWNFLRPEHRFAYSIGLGPEVVVGEEDGRQRPALSDLVDKLGELIVKIECEVYKSVSEEVYYENVDPFGYKGRIILKPLKPGEGIVLNVTLSENSIDNVLINQEGLKDKSLLKQILRAQTPFLIGINTKEALLHAIGDVTADIVGLGGLTDVEIIAELNFFYHALTVGAIKKSRFVKKVGVCRIE